MAFLLISGVLAIAVGIAARNWAQRRVEGHRDPRSSPLQNPLLVQTLVSGALIVAIALIYGFFRWG